MPYRFLKLTRADLIAIREIDRLSFEERDQYEDAFYDELIDSDAFEVLGIADESEHIAAWALVDKRCEPIRIRSLAVHPDFRRRGFATALVQIIIDRHAAVVDLLVEPDNVAAIALYRKLGFTISTPDPAMPERLRMVRNEGNA